MVDKSENITIVYFNEKAKSVHYNPNITRLEKNALFTADDGTIYAIRYYNHKAKVAFATLKEEI